MRAWLRVGLFVAIPYLGCVVMLAFLQRSLIYHPTREARIEPGDAGLPPGRVHTVTVAAADRLLLRGWHVLADGRRAAGEEECGGELRSGRYLVVYFPGNGGSRPLRTAEFRVLTALDANVFLFDYRGYADNAGSPSERHLAADARAIWDYATRVRKVPGERIVLYGESLGGGVAVRLAADLCDAGTPPAGLVLRSTFSSLVDAGAYHYPWLPVRWLMVDRYLSEECIPRVTCPILQVHGTRDRIVPMRIGRRLFEAAPATAASGVAKRFVELAGAGHNDVMYVAEAELRRAVAEFLAQLRASPRK